MLLQKVDYSKRVTREVKQVFPTFLPGNAIKVNCLFFPNHLAKLPQF